MADPQQPYARRLLPDPRLATTQLPTPPDALQPPQQAAQPPLAALQKASRIYASPEDIEASRLRAALEGEPTQAYHEPTLREATWPEWLSDQAHRGLSTLASTLPAKVDILDLMGIKGHLGELEHPTAVNKVGLPPPGLGEPGTALSDKALAEAEHLSRAPVERVGERLLISPRILGAKGKNFTPAPAGQILLPTIKAAAEDPEYFAKLAAHARESPMLKPREARLSDKGVVSAFADRGAENIDALFGMAPQGVVERGGLWYPGGQKIGDALAKEAGVHPNAGMGVIARLSPGTDWDMNIDNAQRIGRWWKALKETDQPFTQEHFDQYLDSTLEQAAEWIKSKKLTGDKLATYQASVADKIAEARSHIDHPWSALPPTQRAQLVRAHSEMNEPQTFARYAPEGHIVMPKALGVNGKELTVKWQSYDNLGRALAMLDDPTDAAISRLLGRGHKIRSFFNNLSVPTDPRSLTADVHNVAGTNLRPLGGSQSEVKAVTGGTPGSALTGIEGTYPLYQEATTRAAAARGIVPNKAQSIPWETTRGLFSPSQRSNDAFRQMAQQIWNDYQRGNISLDVAHLQLHDLAGGVKPPAWTRYASKPAGHQ